MSVNERSARRNATDGRVDPLLSIGVFSRRSRLSIKALRLYDQLGLLAPAQVDPVNGYRRYRQSQLTTARLVALLRRLDLSLAQIKEVVESPASRGAELLAAYWEAVERRHASQREIAAYIRWTLSGDERSLGMFDIRERATVEQTVLTERRHVSIEELPTWLGEAMPRLAKAADARGGMTGPPFVIYHGEVNDDGDGPVEVCVPIGAGQAGSAGFPIRIEPAHREAYARLRNTQIDFPQILTAYDAVAAWAKQHGRTITDSPREVYFADWSASGPDDEVCDVAFPIA